MAFSTQFAADQSDQLYCSGSERVWPAGRNIGPHVLYTGHQWVVGDGGGGPPLAQPTKQASKP